jgi:threonyl-tRNA synthetase
MSAAAAPEEMVRLTLPDGSVREVLKGTTGAEVAASIGARLAKDALAVKLEGKVLDLARPLTSSGSFEVVTPRHPDAVDVYRHSTAHLTANAVKRLFPDVKIGIGPAIENGYYYDFDPARPFTPEDLAAIEAEMRKIVAENNPVERLEMSKSEAIAIFQAQNDTLKVEIVNGIPDDTVSCYRQKDFIDLCRGPHVPSTGKLGVFKLTHAAGAYWKGDEKNPMLQRIYGASFLTQKELDEHLKRLELAKARDHRKLGKDMGLFVFHHWAPASPFFLPKGATVYNLLVDYMRELYVKYGYAEVITPQIFDADLFRQSGHYTNYKENMYFTEIEGREFGVKPMNCPGHFLMYKSQAFSYRDLPVRYADFGRLHRYERSGVTQGLTRVRTFSQDDSHIFCGLDQMADEMDRFIEFTDEVYTTFGFTDVKVGLGTRPEKFMGTIEGWDKAEKALQQAFERRGRPFFVNQGDGAFYGPKLDFQVTDAIGRPWQLATLQVDFSQPENFDLTYTGEDGAKHRPVVLHRALLGSLERFLGVLIEHTGGDFPFWLAPEQARVVPVSEKVNAYAELVGKKLAEAGIRHTLDLRNEKLGAKIRHGELDKVPALLVIGEKEQTAGTVSLRRRGSGDAGSRDVAALIAEMKELVASRAASWTTVAASAAAAH